MKRLALVLMLIAGPALANHTADVRVLCKAKTSKGAEFTDAIFYDLAFFQTLTESEREIVIAYECDSRLKAWEAKVAAESKRVPAEPTLAELQARKDALAAELADTEAKIAKKAGR